MLDERQIQVVADDAAAIAHRVLAIDIPCSVRLIRDENFDEDGLFDTQKNEILINLVHLEPFSEEMTGGAQKYKDEEERLLDENYRHMLKVCYLVFHEMRHLYQKRAVEAYAVNKEFSGKLVPQPESDKKCERWLKEMQGYTLGDGEEVDIEADANDFAYYLTNRYPIPLPMQRTSRRLAAMKRKYDKVDIPESI